MRDLETVRIGGKTHLRVWPRDKPITDGTVRCMFCGQIDEAEYHDNRRCPMTADFEPEAAHDHP